MVVVVLVAEFRLAETSSLKDKRSVIKSLVQRTAQRFRVSCAEVGHQDDIGRADVAAAIISGTVAHGEAVLEAALRFMEAEYPVDLVRHAIEQR